MILNAFAKIFIFSKNPDINRLTQQHREHYNLWMIQMRWIFIFVAILISYVSLEVIQVIPKKLFPYLLFTIASIIIANFIFTYLHQHKQKFILTSQFIFDIIALQVLLHFSGGIETPVSSIIIFHVILAGLFLEPKKGFLVSAFVFALTTSLYLAEAYEWIEHYTIILFPHGEHNENHAAHHLSFVYSTIAFNFILWSIISLFISRVAGWVDFVESYLIKEKKESERSEKKVSKLTSRLVHIRDSERIKFSKQLHDSIGGSLFALELKMHTLLYHPEKQNQTLYKEKTHELLEQLRKMMAETRKLSHSISPLTELDENLIPAMVDLITTFKNAHPHISVSTVFEKNIDNCSQSLKLNLYLIMQEGLKNIHKYSEAKNIDIRMQQPSEAVTLIIKDDGGGFKHQNKHGDVSGIGLQIVSERVKRHNGKLKIISNNTGVCIAIRIKTE